MNMKKTLTAAAIGTTLLCAPLSSLAATETETFRVLLNLTASCTIDEATDLDFGSQTEAAVNTGGITSTSNIGVTCSTGTAYDIGLSGTNGSRNMTSGNGSSVAYELYQDAANNTAWDNTSVQSATSNSSHTVYGLIPAQTATINAADNIDGDTGVNLSDTVTVTVTF